MADSSVSLGIVMLKIVGFFIFAGVVGFLFLKFYRWWTGHSEKGLRRHSIIAFVFCLLLSFCAEQFFGVADITGAFIAGLVLSMTEKFIELVAIPFVSATGHDQAQVARSAEHVVPGGPAAEG